MTKLERLRREYKSWGRWYYHLVLDSLGERNLFNGKDEYVNGMNIVALAQFLTKVGVIQFDWMRNHGHFIVLATGLQCCRFFDYCRYRLNARLIKDGYPPLPDDWFFKLIRLDSFNELVNAASYSARNAYDARGDILPGGYLWSSNYLMFSDINEILDFETIGDIGTNGMIRILGSNIKLPSSYKVCKLGFILPESYLLRTDDGTMTKARSLYKDSKDYAYHLFRDHDTYRRVASDIGEEWSPAGGDVEPLISNLLEISYGVRNINQLDAGKRSDLAVTLGVRYGLNVEDIASRLGLAPSMVSKLIYSYKKKNPSQVPDKRR